MRIVLDLQACQATNRERGIGRYSMSLAQAMARQAGKHDLRIVLNSRFPDTIEPIRRAFDGLIPSAQVHVFDVPGPVAEIDPANAWRCRAAERVRENYLSCWKPDIVHVSSLFEGLVDEAVTSIAHCDDQFDTAVTLYDLIPLLRKETYLADPNVRAWYYRKLQALKNAGLLLSISQHSRQEAITALQLPQDRVINISTAVDALFRQRSFSFEEIAALKKRHGLSKPFLMYTGGIDHRKNIEGLIEAFARLPVATRTQYQLAIVCKIHDHDRQRLQSLASRFGLGNNEVVFTGFVTEEDLVALYNLCALFVFPSLHEGFGLPALEAMSCGAPVIGSNTSSIPEVIGLEDALFDPANTQAITAKIQQALSDEGFRGTLQEHGLKQAKLFSWEASAKCALQAFEHLHQCQRKLTGHVVIKQARPRLAYISPLPAEKSGIADYSAELLPELARHYEIDVIVDQTTIDDAWIAANFPVRSVGWFEAHADDYDRILYHFGNSAFHQHMFGLLEKHPGIVVLHDFFLSGILHYLEHVRTAGTFSRALYESHGYVALMEAQQAGQEAAVWKYPCNSAVLKQALGVIVHSSFSMRLNDIWHGAGSAASWRLIPHLRALPDNPDRQAARRSLGFANTDFVICSFGILGPSKLNDRLLNAWLNSPLAEDERCHLVFVGENQGGSYGENLTETIAASRFSKRIKITGFASHTLYRTYLAAANTAVQLRTKSRGETSGTVLDCMAYGIPTIVNAHGSSSDLPAEVLLKLADEFSQADLIEALVLIWKETEQRESLSRRAVEYIRTSHHPARIGEMYRDAIEHFAVASPGAHYRRLIDSIATISAPVAPTQQDWAATAVSIASNQPSRAPRQLLVDISELVQRDAKSGIQRVVRNVLKVLLGAPPAGYHVEPVYDAGGYYAYARNFTCHMLGLPSLTLEDDPIEVHAGDAFLGLDLAPHNIPQNRDVLIDMRNRDVNVYFVVYDLLPILRPDVFVEGAQSGFTAWLETATAVADGVVCISRAVADELAAWLEQRQTKRLSPLQIGYFHLGADIPSSITDSTQQDADPVLERIGAHPSILMVGTIEPRKAYAQALAAFELLWKDGVDVNFVIVGKQGWMMESLVEQLRAHPESGKRLFWFEGASDAMLLNLYASTSALLAASEGEGFGLPLIEAAQHKLPIIARDLPVFWEVAGNHAFYFKGLEASNLAEALQNWLDLHARKQAPASGGLRWLTWAESSKQLLDVVQGQQWYRVAFGNNMADTKAQAENEVIELQSMTGT